MAKIEPGYADPSRGRKSSSDALTRAVRLFQIVTLIRSHTPGRPLGRPELAKACRCSTKAIGRDISLLQRELVPIEYDKSTRAYTLPAKGWAYPVVLLTPEDVLALALARGLLGAPGVPHREAINAALDKATVGLPPALKALLDQAAGALRLAHLPRDYAAAPLGPLAQAASARRSVWIDYDSYQSGRAWRQVDPYALEAREGVYWELHGWCHNNHALRTFALDRLHGVRVLDETFTLRTVEWAHFCQETATVGGLRGGQEIEVRVHFAPPVRRYVRAKQWPSTLAAHDQADGSVLLTGTVRGVEGMTNEILYWRRHAHVLGGPELRAAMAEEVRHLTALYASGTAEKFEKK